MILEELPGAVMLDLERPADRIVLEEPEAFFDANADRLVYLDAVQRVPVLFPTALPRTCLSHHLYGFQTFNQRVF